AFETRPQRQMLALNLLHRELPHRVLRGREMPPRAYSAEGHTPEHRSREAQRAACRSAAGRRSRQPLEAASAESEGPNSPIIRRERAACFGGRLSSLLRPCAVTRHASLLVFGEGRPQASELPSIDTRLLRVVTRDAKRHQQGAELQELPI